jgi:hypothetical protein
MKKILFMAAALSAGLVNAQTSNAKLQWSRVQYGIASDYEHALKSYRDPSSGNVFVLYQGIYNFGVTRFDNSGASTANNKYRAPHNWYSFGGDFEYTGNNTYVVSGGESAIYPLVIKASIDGTVLWKYSDQQVPVGVVYTNYYDLLKGVTVSSNGNVVAGGVAADTASLYSISSSGSLNWKKHYQPAGYSKGVIMDVQTDAFDNIYTCGTIKNASGNFDAFIMATDQNGVLKWEHLIDGAVSGNDSAMVLRIDNSGNTYVGGIIKDSSSTNNSMFFAKYNASGGQQYFKKFHVAGQVGANLGDVFVDQLGSLYACETVYTGTNYAVTYVNKYNSSGGLLWTSSFDNIYGIYDMPKSIKANGMGDVYVAGTTENSAPDSPNEFLIKIPASGMNWTYTYDNSNNHSDKAVDVQIDNSGNSYVIGTNATYYNIEANVTIFKCSNNGTFQWDGLFDSPGNLTDDAVRVVKDGSYAIYTLSSIQNNISNTDASITKYDSKGVLLWQVMYDYQNQANIGKSMVMDSQKNIYVLCDANNGGSNSIVLKYDSLGSQVFEKFFPEGYTKMVIDANGNLFLAGGSSTAYNNYNALKLDQNGNVLWTYTPGAGSYNHYANFINVNSAGELFVFGYKMSPWNSSILRVAKFNSGGTPAWSYDISNIDTLSSAGVFISDMLLDNASNMYITGKGKNNLHVNDFILIMKIDQAGNIKWRSEYNGNDNRSCASNDMEMDSYGNLWTIDNNNFIQRWDTANGGVPMDVRLSDSYHGAGFLAGGNSLLKKYGNGQFLITTDLVNNYDYSLALVKTDTLGIIKWIQTYDGAAGGTEYATDFAFDLQGRIVVHANSQETEGSLNDVATLKFCDLPVPAITSSGSYVNICRGNPVTLTAAAASSYSWFPLGSSQQSVTTDTTGNYYCFVYQADGCFQSTDTIHVTQKLAPSVQNICLVTVDSLSTHNILLWDKTGLSLVDHFNLYREDVTNIYNLIATVPFDSLSEYHDHASDPNVTTKRYKITAVDTCGVESPMSPYHNTIYITDNGSGQFTWNLYSIENSANPVTNYLLMRDDNGTGAWHQVGSTAGTQQTLNDPNYTNYLNGAWRVETVWGISCTSTMRIGSSVQSTIVKSKSNISNNRTMGVKNNAEKLLNVYPNPTNGNISITFGPSEKTVVRVTSLLGEEVFSATYPAGTAKCDVDLSRYQGGTYLVQVTTNAQTFQRRIIKN